MNCKTFAQYCTHKHLGIPGHLRLLKCYKLIHMRSQLFIGPIT